MANRPRKHRFTTAVMFIGLATLSGRSFAQDYRLAAGDSINVFIAGIPNSDWKITVGGDGKLVVPLAGTFEAAGVGLDKLRASVRTALSKRNIRFITQDGREVFFTLSPDDVTVDVAAYRPVYVSGEVETVGPQAFRPGMTVRQVVAASGGEGRKSKGGEDARHADDLQGRLKDVEFEILQERIKLKATKAEIKGETTFDSGEASQASRDPVEAAVARGEAAQLAARVDKFRTGRDAAQAAVVRATARVAVLSKQYIEEDEGAKADATEAAKVADFMQRGITSAQRTMEARRMSLLSATRALQTAVQVETAKNEREEAINRVQTLEMERRVNLLSNLHTSEKNIEKLSITRSTLIENLLSTDSSASALRDLEVKFDFTIHRTVGSKASVLSAQKDDFLDPGDVLEVRSTTGTGRVANSQQ
ncbi:hypothetical protein HPGCJGGD_3453 [Methylobacterium haplocladii]|nr:hypothetical protein HPGCJGGD_3453 [Methylobacterium haplocladii]